MVSTYWLQRQQDALFNQQLKIGEKQLSSYYLQAYKEIKSFLLDIIGKDPEKILMSDLYRYNKYYDLLNSIRQNLTAIGEKSLPTIEKVLTEMYSKNTTVVNSFVEKSLGIGINFNFPLNESHVKAAINRVWCPDGKNWSQRVWGNQEKVAEAIERGVTNSIVRGASRDEIIKQLRQDFDVGFIQADRLVRTELSYVQNQSTLDRYAEMGIEEYEILETIDNKTCDTCKKMNGKRFKISESIVGVNMPPFHPNGRGTILPIIKE